MIECFQALHSSFAFKLCFQALLSSFAFELCFLALLSGFTFTIRLRTLLFNIILRRYTTECNLADLDSVRRFAATWHDSGRPLDTLVLNAGVQYSGDNDMRKTENGFEITVGTNHLAGQCRMKPMIASTE